MTEGVTAFDVRPTCPYDLSLGHQAFAQEELTEPAHEVACDVDGAGTQESTEEGGI